MKKSKMNEYEFYTLLSALGESINFWYEQGYMVLCSAFPNNFPPLPGKTPMSYGKLIVYLVHLYLFYKFIDNIRIILYNTFKFICYFILKYFPYFTIKYLFFFDKPAQTLWIPLLSRLKKPFNAKNRQHNDIIVLYNIIRYEQLGRLFGYTIVSLCNVGIYSWLLHLIHTNVVA